MGRYSLDEIKRLVSNGRFTITFTALQTATELAFDRHDVADCIVGSLENTHFYKSMPSEKETGLWQDVYKLTYQAKRLYVKLQIGRSGEAKVVSFKEE